MTALTNTKWTLKARPEGIFRADMCSQIETETVDLSSIEENEVVIKSELLSVDAFLRTMLDAEAYHGSVDIGATLPALGIGTVMAAGSKTKLKVGSKVRTETLTQFCVFASFSSSSSSKQKRTFLP